MRVGRSTEVGEGGLALLGKGLAYGVHGKGDLHVKGAIEVSIGTNDEVLTGEEREKPVLDEGGLGEEVASAVGEELVLALAGGLRLLHGKGDGTGGVTGVVDKVLPDSRAVEVNGDDVGAKGHEDLERSHGGASSKHDEVLVRKVEPLGVGNALENGIACGLLDRTVTDPLVDLGDEGISGKGLVLVGDLELGAGLLGGSLDGASLKLGLVLLRHGLLEGDGRAILLDEFEALVHVVEASLGDLEGGRGGLGLELNHRQEMLGVSETPVLSLKDLLSSGLVDGADGGSESVLPSLGSGTLSLLVGGENETLGRGTGLSEALPEGGLAVSNHVHVHERAARDIDNHRDQVEPREVGGEGGEGGNKGRIIGRIVKGEELPSDPHRVEDVEERVPQVEEGVRSLLGGITGDESRHVEKVARDLDEGPSKDHETRAVMGLSDGRIYHSEECDNTRHDLHGWGRGRRISV